MGKSGENHFRHNDAVRALQSARDGGLEPVMMEVVLGPDTVTFRVYGGKAAATGSTQDTADAEWTKEIAKLKASSKGGKGQ